MPKKVTAPADPLNFSIESAVAVAIKMPGVKID